MNVLRLLVVLLVGAFSATGAAVEMLFLYAQQSEGDSALVQTAGRMDSFLKDELSSALAILKTLDEATLSYDAVRRSLQHMVLLELRRASASADAVNRHFLSYGRVGDALANEEEWNLRERNLFEFTGHLRAAARNYLALLALVSRAGENAPRFEILKAAEKEALETSVKRILNRFNNNRNRNFCLQLIKSGSALK